MNTEKQNNFDYDVVIVGGGIVGSALLYVLSQYTNISRIALLERRSGIGMLNSDAKNNSQTLHFGDIETHYTLKKSTEVYAAANLLKNFLRTNDSEQKLYTVLSKMVLAVGDKEVAELRERFEMLKPTFPHISLLQKGEIAKAEPRVMDGRDTNENVIALSSSEGYVVNFGAVAQKFVQLAKNVSGKTIDIFYDTEVTTIEPQSAGHLIHTSRGDFQTRVLEVAAAGYSLHFARQYGLGKNWVLANIIGNFYTSKNVLNGKVYRMQIPGLPFGTVHGDSDVRDTSITRFGPTAKAILLLDRERFTSIKDYFGLLGLNLKSYIALLSVVKQKIVVKYMALNVLYDFPLIGKYLFLKELRKIVPTLKTKDLKRAEGEGGVRPQIVDIAACKTILGEGKLYGENCIFNITPSPGASVCLGSAREDAQKIVGMLGGDAKFDEARLLTDLG